MDDLLARLLEENWRHARLSEDRRIAVTCASLVAATGIQVAFVFSTPSSRATLLAAWTVLLGLFGLVVMLRLEERAQFHARRARRIRRLLDERGSGLAETLLASSDEEHGNGYRVLAVLRLHYALVGVHSAIAAFGFADLALILARS